MDKANKSASLKLSADNLSMPREKKKSVTTSLLYLAGRIGDLVLGNKRTLRFFLSGSWLFWRLAFERSGQIYDSEFHNRTKALSEEFLAKCISKDDSLIDVGCGVGRWCRVAARYGRSVVGIDYSEDLINYARSNTDAENIEYIVGDVTKDISNREFDLALLIHVIEHIEKPDDLLQSLRKIAKKIIVEVPDFESDPLNWVRLETNCPYYTDADHVREYTQTMLNSQLERNGWIVLENWKNGGSVLAVAERKPD